MATPGNMQDNTNPYFINLDEDAFRSNRFMYVISKEITVFGSKGDIQPQSMAVVRDHCKIRYDMAANPPSIFVIGGRGDTWRNGKQVVEGAEIQLDVFDRIAMGDQLMLFRWPGFEEPGKEPVSADEAVEEFQQGIIVARQSGGGGGASNGGLVDEERRKIMEEREKWEKEKSQMLHQRDEESFQRAMASVDNSIMDLLPKTKEAKQIVDLLNRVTMSFDVVLQKGEDQIPKVKISVVNSNPKYEILIDPNEFLPKLSLLKDELMKLRDAIDAPGGGRDYELPERHDPLYLMFDNDYLLGTATHWPEYLAYNLETDNEEKKQEIKNVAVPYNTVGLLEVKWLPLAGPDDDGASGAELLEIMDASDFLGKPWTYKLQIIGASDLPVFCEMAYVEYDFYGETFTTEAVQQTTFSPVFDYSHVHHVPLVDQKFLDYLKTVSFEMRIHVTQHIKPPQDALGTQNNIVVESIKSGEAKGYEAAGNVASRPKSDAEIRSEQLISALAKEKEQKAVLEHRIRELELRVAELEEKYEGGARESKPSVVRQSLETAIITDQIVNNT